MDIEHKETVKKEVPLATEIIRTMKKIIFSLIILIVFIVGGFIWYLSLPVEQTTETVTVDTEDSGITNYMNESNTGDIYNGENSNPKNGD